jgi:transposase InsO family protein
MYIPSRFRNGNGNYKNATAAVYLFAVLNCLSRRALSWRISNTLTTDFCIEAGQEAINRYGTPKYSAQISSVNSPTKKRAVFQITLKTPPSYYVPGLHRRFKFALVAFKTGWQDQATSKRSRFITLVQACTKSLTNFFCEPAVA